MPQMVEHEESMYDEFPSGDGDDTWNLEESWRHLGTLIRRGAIQEDPSGLAELERVLGYVVVHYPPKLEECPGYVLSSHSKHELALIFENTTGIIKSCHTNVVVLKPCFQILLHLAYPPQQPCTPLLEAAVNQLVLTKKNITRMLRAVPANLEDETVVQNVLRMVVRAQQCNARLLSSMEVSSVYRLPEKWKGPDSITPNNDDDEDNTDAGSSSSGESEPSPSLSSSAPDTSSSVATADSATAAATDPPASKRRHTLEFDYYHGEVFSLSFTCLRILRHLGESVEVVSLVSQVICALCSHPQSLYSKIFAHKEEIGLVQQLLTVFERYIVELEEKPSDQVYSLIESLIRTFMKLLMACKFCHLDQQQKQLQDSVSRLLLKTLRPCIEHKKTMGTPCQPRDNSLLSCTFRYCLQFHYQTVVDDLDVILFSVQIVEQCRVHLKPYLPSALRMAYGVGSALPQADWIKSFRTKKEHNLHISVLRSLEGGHVQDDYVLKECLRLLRSLVTDPLWNEDLFKHGILECLSVLSSRLCCNDAYGSLMLDLVRVGFQLTCCSLEKRLLFVEKKYIHVLRAALVNHTGNWAILRCALGSMSMLFRVKQVVATTYKLNFTAVILQTIHDHAGTDSRTRYLHNVVSHMACLAVPSVSQALPYVPSLTNDTRQIVPAGGLNQSLALNHFTPSSTAAPTADLCASMPSRSRSETDASDASRQAQCSVGNCTAASAAAESTSSSSSGYTLLVDRLHGMASHGCSTCASSTAISLELIMTAKDMPVEAYEDMTRRGWFRRGSVPMSHYRHIHHPDCGDYETCTDVERFDPTLSTTYKRVLKRARKAGITVETVRPRMDKSAFELYNSYQMVKHGKVLKAADGYSNHIVDTPLRPETRNGVPYGTIHQLYHMNGRLVGVGVLDVLPHCLISVYMFYDISCPQVAKLSLGVYAVLQEIDYAKRLNREHGASIDSYMLGGFCPLNKKVSYKANYPPVRFCAPWASSLWVSDLRTARLLAGFSALRQHCRSRRLSAIMTFLASQDVNTSRMHVLRWLRSSSYTLGEVYDLVISVSEEHHQNSQSTKHPDAMSMDDDDEALASAVGSSDVCPAAACGLDDSGGAVASLLVLPSVLQQLVDTVVCHSCDTLPAVTCDLAAKLTSCVVDDAVYRSRAPLQRETPTFGQLLELVVECPLSGVLPESTLSKQSGVLAADVVPALDCCLTTFCSLPLAEVVDLIMGCERSAGEVDPDYARPVTVQEAYHGLCNDTEVDLAAIYSALAEHQQVGGDVEQLRLNIQHTAGHSSLMHASQLVQSAASEWHMLSQEVLYQNLASLASALGPDLAQRTVINLVELEAT